MNSATCGARRMSISDFSARQLENPYSRAIGSCASASFVPGFVAHRNASRSFASFFRYS